MSRSAAGLQGNGCGLQGSGCGLREVGVAYREGKCHTKEKERQGQR